MQGMACLTTSLLQRPPAQSHLRLCNLDETSRMLAYLFTCGMAGCAWLQPAIVLEEVTILVPDRALRTSTAAQGYASAVPSGESVLVGPFRLARALTEAV